VLPATVQATLAARIDRLDDRERDLLRRAAVIGFELSKPLLLAICGLEEGELEDALEALVSAELLVDRVGQPGVEYVFKHPLTQEVAYHSLLRERRQQLHGEVARAIEQLNPERLDERAALVAHHWEAAGEALLAARWSARAADWVGLSDMTQALAHWRKVAALADGSTHSRAAETLARLAHVRQLDYGWRLGMSDEEARLHYEQARQILARREGDPRLVGLTSLYATVRGFAGHLDDYEALSEQAYRAAKAIGDPTLRMGTLVVIMQARQTRGRIADAVAVADEAIELGAQDPTLASRESSVVCPYAWCLMFRGWILCDAGRLDDASESLDRALRAAQEYGDVETEGWAHMLYVLVARYSGRVETMLDHATRAYEIAEQTGAAFHRAWQLYFLGYARFMVGDTDEAIASIERSIEIAREAHTALEQEPIRLASLAEALLSAGDNARALETARESVAIALERGNAGNLPYCYRVLTEALLASDHEADAAHTALNDAEKAAHATGALAELPHIERLRATLVPVS
jgi:predicted ATPase